MRAPSMVHLFGLQTYADIMSEFAAGERYINRVWSASADEYDNEAETLSWQSCRAIQHTLSRSYKRLYDRTRSVLGIAELTQCAPSFCI